jgi:hypothetical protein
MYWKRPTNYSMTKLPGRNSPLWAKCCAWFDGLLDTRLFGRQNKGRRRQLREHMERAERAARNERLDDMGPDGKRYHKHFRHDPAAWNGEDT